MRNKSLYVLFIIFGVCMIFQACQSEDQITYARYYVNGKGLYETHCQNCHATDGSGLKNLYPPLTDTIYIKNNQSKLACMIKYGLSDTITVHGQVYDGNMPSNTHLSDIDVTQILVYIGNSFGNNLGAFDMKEVSGALKECR
jgi:cytochrome c